MTDSRLEAARSLLSRYAEAEKEANTTSAIRDFLLATGLALSDEIQEEENPSDTSRDQADLAVPHKNIYIEVKLRIGTGADSSEPSQGFIDQIDGYVEEAREPSAVGLLTDGKHWILRTLSDQPEIVRAPPYRFTLERPTQWLGLFEWLRDNVFINRAYLPCTLDSLRTGFGPASPVYDRHVTAIGALYYDNGDSPSVKIKRELWEMLLGAALGEIRDVDLDDLFVRHTYLVTVVGMITQASFGLDINERAANDPFDLVLGGKFREVTGLVDVVESDFFSWIVEVPNASATIRSIAQHVLSFNWGTDTPSTLAPLLYQTVIPAEERKQLGEYYTPDWLASEIVKTAVTDPLNQRVLDPACGSGSFLVESIHHLAQAADSAGLPPSAILAKLQKQVIGIDVHPVAVHLARAAWVMAARNAITEGWIPDVAVPVYLGDSLQLLYEKEPILGREEILITVTGDARNRELRFPRSLVNRSDTFDLVMSRIAEAIHADNNPHLILLDHDMNDDERAVMGLAVQTLQELHVESLNHIWAYYTRNLVRPISISESKVDVIVGNPPWLTYNKTIQTLRWKLRNLSKAHRIWVGAEYATHQDIAGLFFTRCMDLYLEESRRGSANGVCSMVLPHSALIAGQYEKWRKGEWFDSGAPQRLAADLEWRDPWDLEPLDPNDFFPVPACVVHAQRRRQWRPLPAVVERWEGVPGASTRSTAQLPVSDERSPYAELARQGATIVPRCLFFIEEIPPETFISPAGTIHTNPRRGRQDKPPWKHLDLVQLASSTVETSHVFDAYLGETLVPYLTLDPVRVVLPISADPETKEIDGAQLASLMTSEDVDPASLAPRTRSRWTEMSSLWEDNKGSNNQLNLLGQLDYMKKLSVQFSWQHDNKGQPYRVIYSSSGKPTAAIVRNPKVVIDYTLFWIPCQTLIEAYYLIAIINSDKLRDSIVPFMPKGQFGPRHVQKHLWRLRIPRFDPRQSIHLAVSRAGQAAEAEATKRLDEIQSHATKPISVRKARRELRSWLPESSKGRLVEDAVSHLLERS
ncbi:MAG: N-6 DNA methylase [Chloroflexi bacterium]|nr:N-6 DNA methylase [Chloroflexota bacterium]